MSSVYIIYSQTLDKFYIGSCNDLFYRIDQHLNKEFTKSFTAQAKDWTLLFFRDGLEYQQTRLIEKHIKNMKSKVYIQNLSKYPEIFEKLAQQYHQGL